MLPTPPPAPPPPAPEAAAPEPEAASRPATGTEATPAPPSTIPTPAPIRVPAPAPTVPMPTEEECADLGLVRPVFPPAEVRRKPAFQAAEAHFGLSEDAGPSLLSLWHFVTTFGDLLGVAPFAPEELLEAVHAGESSRLLADVVCALIAFLLGEMEECYVGGHLAAPPQGPAGDRNPQQFAQLLETAWAWGFDPDSWRAELDLMTWPEVLRQLAVVLGLGRRKMNMFRNDPYIGHPLGSAFGGGAGGAAGVGGAPKRQQGREYEDVDTWIDPTTPKLVVPSRFVPGSLKHAAWTILASVGPQGLTCADIAKEMTKRGLRDFKGIKNPPTNVHSGLINDLVFTKYVRLLLFLCFHGDFLFAAIVLRPHVEHSARVFFRFPIRS